MAEKEPPQADEAGYSGRWVARLQGRIVAHGSTPEAARRAAQANRHKERPEISYVYPDAAPQIPAFIDRVAGLRPDQDLYLVGGTLRDALLGMASHDFDIVAPKHAIELARRAAGSLGGDFYVMDEGHDAARVILTSPSGVRDILDFSSFRGQDIHADLEGRDFTINAMALNLKDHSSLDPLNGTIDLRSKVIRACSATAMQDDPIRILRGVRLAAALNFKIDPGTRESMKRAAPSLTSTSAERQRDELFKMLNGPRPDASVLALEMLGVLAHILPELAPLKGLEQPPPHVHDGWGHTLSVMNYLAEILDLLMEGRLEDANGMLASLLMLGIGRYKTQIASHYSRSLNPDRSFRALLEFAALYHDVGKPETKSVDAELRIRFLGHELQGGKIAARRCEDLNLSNDETARVRGIVDYHLRFFHLARQNEVEGKMPSRRAIYHFFRDTGACAVDVILLGLADLRGARGHTLTESAWSAWLDVARALMENLWERPAESVVPPRILDGHELMKALSLEPGPIVGQLLEAIREAQATGEVQSRDEAIKFGRLWISKRGW